MFLLGVFKECHVIQLSGMELFLRVYSFILQFHMLSKTLKFLRVQLRYMKYVENHNVSSINSINYHAITRSC
jgi:hypothetical protein